MKKLTPQEIDRVVAAVPVHLGRSNGFGAALARGDVNAALDCVPRRLIDDAEGGEKWTYQPRRLAFLAEISEYIDATEYAQTLRLVWTTTEKFVDEPIFRAI